MIKAIAVDMDGTFLDSNKQFDRNRFETIFKELIDKNNSPIQLISQICVGHHHLIAHVLRVRMSHLVPLFHYDQ